MGEDETATLVARYAEAAREYGMAAEAGDYERANAAHDVVVAAYRELRSRGADAQRVLLRLSDNPDPPVRLWVASHALDFAPEVGEPILSTLADVDVGTVGFNARMALEQWRKGELRFT